MATSFLEIFYKTNRFLKRYINIATKPDGLTTATHSFNT